MHLKAEHKSIVIEILNKYIKNQEVLAFGSRVHGKNLKDFSDLDLAILDEKQPLSFENFLRLTTELEESNLPIKIDLVQFSKIDDGFKKIILQDGVKLE